MASHIISHVHGLFQTLHTLLDDNTELGALGR